MIQVEDYLDSLVVNVFYSLKMGPFWNKLAKNHLWLSYKEMTRIVAATINVENMDNHHKDRSRNYTQKRKAKDEPKNLQINEG